MLKHALLISIVASSPAMANFSEDWMDLANTDQVTADFEKSNNEILGVLDSSYIDFNKQLKVASYNSHQDLIANCAKNTVCFDNGTVKITRNHMYNIDQVEVRFAGSFDRYMAYVDSNGKILNFTRIMEKQNYKVETYTFVDVFNDVFQHSMQYITKIYDQNVTVSGDQVTRSYKQIRANYYKETQKIEFNEIHSVDVGKINQIPNMSNFKYQYSYLGYYDDSTDTVNQWVKIK